MMTRDALETLKKAAAEGRLAHALLLTGGELPSRLEAAMELARVILCESPIEAAACGSCAQCRLSARDAHPDLRRLAAEPEAKNIKIESVRAMIAEAQFKPFQAKAKVFILELPELMSDAAQNAFLKTLEEPPGRVTFILVPNDASMLLPTVRSRVQSYYCAGTGQAPAPDDPEFVALRERCMARLVRPAAEAGEDPELGRLERREFGALFDALIEELREVLMMRYDATALVRSPGSLAQKREWASRLDSALLTERIEALADAKDKIVSRSMNAKLVMHALWQNIT